MLLLRPSSRRKLSDYGIEVPLLDDRVELLLKNLSVKAKTYLKLSEKPWIVPDDLYRVHTERFVNAVLSNKPDEEIFKCYELIDKEGNYNRYHPKNQSRPFVDLVNYALSHVQGTYEASLHALEDGFCFFMGGGLHHAFPDEGRGFCLLHDVAIAVKKLQFEKTIQRAWIIDIDAHKGDGTAVIFKDDEMVRTLSIHMKSGWPLDMGEGLWQTPSTIDIEIEKGEESTYLPRLKKGLVDLARKDITRPEIAFVVMGADPYEHDVLPSAKLIQLNLEQMKERDQMIRDFLKDLNIPQVYVMAGGYGPRVHEVYSQFINEVLYS